jgi:predicted O-methyltransferase YrrM
MIDTTQIANEAINERHALQKPWELAKFLDLIIAHDPKVIYEIGVSLGGMLWAMAMALQGERTFVSIDLPGGPFGGSGITPDEIGNLVLEANSLCDVIVIRGDSKTVELPKEIPDPDLIFIDGDHTFSGVLGDWNRYMPLVKKGGIVAFHDIVEHPPETIVEVKQLWDLIKKDPGYGSTHEIIEHNGQSSAGIGIIYV